MGFIKSVIDRLRGRRAPVSAEDAALAEAGQEIARARELHGQLVARVSSLIAERTRLTEQVTAAAAEAQKWSELAVLAAGAGKPEDARVAVTNRLQAEARHAALQEQYAKDDQLVDQLMADLERAKAKIAAAEHDFTQLGARKDSAEIRIQLAQTLGQDLGSGPASSLGDLAQAVEEREAEAAAWDQILDPASQAQAARAPTGNQVDQEVAALMEQARAKHSTQQ